MKEKLGLFFLFLAIVAGYYYGYRPEHSKALAHETSVIDQIRRTNKAQELNSKLEAAWKQTLSNNPADGDVDVAVFDNANGGTVDYTTAPGATFNVASVMKLSILEALLLEDQQNGLSGLTSSQMQEAQPMIENSDNDTATDLYIEAGGSKGLNDFFSKVGATQSTAGDHWGLTQSTAQDQLKVINAEAYPGKFLNATMAGQANQLMDNIESDQRWGVTGGVPSGVSVELKDGWLSDADNDGTNGWNVNSVGHVHGQGVDYTIAVLTDDNNSMQDGVNTIQSLSTDAWNIINAVDKS